MTEPVRATISPTDFDNFMRDVMEDLAETSQQYYWRGMPLPAMLFGLTHNGELEKLSIQDSINIDTKKVIRKLQASIITKGLCTIALAFEAQLRMRIENEEAEDKEVILLEFQAPLLEHRMVVIPLQREVFEYEDETQHYSQANWNQAYRADGVIMSDFQIFTIQS